MTELQTALEGDPVEKEALASARKHWVSAVLDLLQELGMQLGTLALAVGIALGVMALQKASPEATLNAIWTGALSSPYAIQTTLGNAIPCILAGGGVWLAYSVGLFNIGGEGQLQAAGLCTALASVWLKQLSGPLNTVVVLVVGAAAGLLWASIPAVIRVMRNGSEIVVGIMLNFVAILLVNYLVNGPVEAPATNSPITSQVPLNAELSTWVGFALACGVVLSAIVVVVRTRVGLKMRAVGRNTDAAFHAGLRIKRIWLGTFLMSGALLGLGGALEVMCVQHAVSQGWSLNWGLLGVGIAFLCIRRPVLILAWGFVFGIMQAAGPAIEVATSVSDSVVTFILMLPVASYFVLRVIVSGLAVRHEAGNGTVRGALASIGRDLVRVR